MENTSRKSIIISAIVLILVIGALGFQYFLSSNESASSNTPPKITINYPKYKGSISGDVVCQIPGTYTFTADAPAIDKTGAAADIETGIHIYHSDLPITGQKIIDKMDQVKGNKILIAYYPSSNNADGKFSVYKSLAGQNSLDLSTTIPANEGFTIFSCMKTKIYGIKTENEFGTGLPEVLNTAKSTGWVLMSAPDTNVGKNAKAKNKNVKSTWAQQGVDFNFGSNEEAPESSTLKGSYKMVWVEFGAAPLIKANIIKDPNDQLTLDSNGIPPSSANFLTFGITSDQDVAINKIDLKITAASPAKLDDVINVQLIDGSNALVSAKVSTDGTASLIIDPAYPLTQSSGKKLSIKANFIDKAIADGGKYTISITDIKFSDPTSIIDKGTLGAGVTKTASKAAVAAKTITITLTSAGAKTVDVIKLIKDITGLGLADAKAIVDASPSQLPGSFTQAEADQIKKNLETAGATVTLGNGSAPQNLTVKNSFVDSFELTWDPPKDIPVANMKEYKFTYGTGKVVGSNKVNTLTVSVAANSDASEDFTTPKILTSGTDYWFSITAVDKNGKESDPATLTGKTIQSQEKAAIPPSAPTGLKVVTDSSGTTDTSNDVDTTKNIILKWDSQSGTNYIWRIMNNDYTDSVFKSDTNGSVMLWELKKDYNGEVSSDDSICFTNKKWSCNSVNIQGEKKEQITPGKYKWGVKAYNDAGESDWAMSTFTIKPAISLSVTPKLTPANDKSTGAYYIDFDYKVGNLPSTLPESYLINFDYGDGQGSSIATQFTFNPSTSYSGTTNLKHVLYSQIKKVYDYTATLYAGSTKSVDTGVATLHTYQCNETYTCNGEYDCSGTFSCTTYTCNGKVGGGSGGTDGPYKCLGAFICTSKDLYCDESVPNTGCYVDDGHGKQEEFKNTCN